MVRNKKQNMFEDLTAIAASFPWWVGILLALVTYLFLHHYAVAVVALSLSPGQMGANVVHQLGKSLAMFGQYLVPLAFLIGAGISAYGRHKRTTLITGVKKASSANALNTMSWQEFEMLVGEAFRRKGYAVAETGGGRADGGVDLVLNKDGEKFLVQCKQWKALKVGVVTIRELYGVMAAGGAAGGFVVTSGVFTREAKAFAEGRNIELVDDAKLMSMIKQAQQQPRSSVVRTQLSAQISTIAASNPCCPRCGSAMVKRAAKQDGNAFWGCSTFPKCRGTVSIN